jgi:hypothetical protein
MDREFSDLLDAFVYGPIGLLTTRRADLSEVASAGRSQVDQQFALARVLGRLAVETGRRKATGEFSSLCHRLWPARPTPSSGAPEPPVAETTAPSPFSAGVDLPIEGYDTLAASQIVARLATLTVEELEVIRAYETEHRARKTVLGKISQLT